MNDAETLVHTIKRVPGSVFAGNRTSFLSPVSNVMALFDQGSRIERDTDEGDQRGCIRTLGTGKTGLDTVMQP